MRGDVEHPAGSGGEPARGSRRDVSRDLSSERLLGFLSTRRWFGAKGREPQSAEIVDMVPVGDAGSIVRVDVTLRDGIERYQLTLSVRGNELREGLEDESFRDIMRDAIATGAALSGPDCRWVPEWIGAPPHELPPLRLAGTEYSNTSLIFGDSWIMKLFRRLERGEHPEAEVARFLTTRAHFPHTPELLAEVRFDAPDGGEVAAILQRFLAGSRDAWSVVVERGREGMRARRRARIPFAAEAAALGEVTRAMHVALASDDRDAAFAPEPATAADLAHWASGVREASDRALTLLERSLASASLPADVADDAKTALGRRQAASARIEGWLAEIGDDVGMRMRHHGDYHLGQVLESGAGAFMVIDFEGEPARPLEERRAKHSALRDVAGMLRSFAYAAATCAEAVREEIGERNAKRRAARWERSLRDAFLRGYLPEGREHPRFLPHARARLDVLLELFEVEKLFYELAYELNNRPTWVWIPLRGVISRFRTRSSGARGDS